MLKKFMHDQSLLPDASFLIRSASFDVYLVVINYLLTLPGNAFHLRILRALAGCEIGEGTSLQRGIRLTTKGGVRIGSGCNINYGTVLDGRGSLVIGDLVNVSPEAVFLTADHNPDSETFEGRCRPVTIGSRSWIATRALVLPGTTVGTGAVIGAGSVVASDIPPWSVVAGVPARKIGERPPGAQRILPPYRRWLH